jgi:hypothetical protein
VSARGGQTISIPTSLSDPRPVDISPDRTELLVLSVKGPMAKELRGTELWVVPVAGGSARPVGNVLARDAAWGADGETILYADGHEIRLVNKDGSNRRTFLSVPGKAQPPPVWGPPKVLGIPINRSRHWSEM